MIFDYSISSAMFRLLRREFRLLGVSVIISLCAIISIFSHQKQLTLYSRISLTDAENGNKTFE